MNKPFEIFIIWGEVPEQGARPDRYAFSTEAEREAFIYGVSEMSGWLDYTQVPGRNYVVSEDHEIVACDDNGDPLEPLLVYA